MATSTTSSHGILAEANSAKRQRIIESLNTDIQEELGHAQLFANRIKELYGTVPGSSAFKAEQTPDQRIAWTSEDGPEHAGVVTFHRIDDAVTRVMLQLDYEPEGLAEKAGDALGLVTRRVKGDLGRFKELIESRGQASGAWRGEVEQDATS